MKKYYFFAALATVGLFASCSSDENFDEASEARQATSAVGNDAAAVNLKIGNLTRGTGTVGNTTGGDQWAGQKVNVYMLKTGTLDLAYELKDDGTDDTTKPLFDNQEMKVESSSAALVLDIAANAVDAANWKDRTVTNKYFPGSGVFDFWGYRTDGAETAAPADNAGVKSVAFEIDGSQDLMSGKAVPLAKSATATDYGHYNSDETGVYGRYAGANVTVANNKIYSAYSARREIDPIMHFQHQLARFTFEVKGANTDACILEGETNADKKAKAVNVTQVKVTSKYKGNLVIAYTSAAGTPDPIDWDPATTSLYLKQRAQKVTAAATGDFYAIKVNRGVDDGSGNPTYSYTVATAVAPAAPSAVGASLINSAVIDNDMEVYDAYTTDATTGLPTGNVSTISDIKTSLTTASTSSAVFYRYFPATDVVYSADPSDIDMTADLVELQPVQPTYTAPSTINKVKVGEALLLPADVNEYKLEVTLKQLVNKTTKIVVDANGNKVYVNDATTPTLYYLLMPAVAAVDADYTQTDLYSIPASVTTVANATDLATAAKALTTTGDKVYFQTDAKKYINVNVTTANDGVNDAVYTTSDLYTEPATVVSVADNAAFVAAANALTATGHTYYKIGTTKYVDVNVTTGATAAADAYYYEKTAPATHIAVATFEAGIGTTYFEWKTEVNEEKTQLVKQTIKLPNDPSTGTAMAFEAGKTYNVVLTVNGVEAIGGEDSGQPIVDVWVSGGTDIELTDDTED